MDGWAKVENEVEALHSLGGRAYCKMFRLRVVLEHAEMAYEEIEAENGHLRHIIKGLHKEGSDLRAGREGAKLGGISHEVSCLEAAVRVAAEERGQE